MDFFWACKTLDLHLQTQNVIDDLSYCLSLSFLCCSTCLSLSVLNQVDGIELICCGGLGRLVPEESIPINSIRTWTHFCIAVDFEELRFTVHVDSRIYHGRIWSLQGRELAVSGGGILVVGQEQDLVGGGFNVEQSFEGLVVDLLVFPEFLEEERMREFGRCGTMVGADGALVSLKEEDWEFYDTAKSINITKAEVCGEAKKTHVMFPEPRSYRNSRQLCHMLKGTMAAPTSEEENRAIVEATRDRVDVCSISWSVYAYLDFEVVVSEDSWTYVDRETNASVSYTNFRKGYSFPVSDYRCVFLDSRKLGQWVVYPCGHHVCTVCTFTKPTILRLRGLCSNTLIDRYFYIANKKNGKTAFDGVGHTEISWNNSTWVLQDRLYPHVEATMLMTERDQYPFGLRTWNITGNEFLA